MEEQQGECGEDGSGQDSTPDGTIQEFNQAEELYEIQEEIIYERPSVLR